MRSPKGRQRMGVKTPVLTLYTAIQRAAMQKPP